MFSEKLNKAFNDQINFEFSSAHVYLAMAAYCSAKDLPGFAHFFHVQYREEVDHALKMFHFVDSVDGTVEITGFENPEGKFASLTEVFEAGLAHEKLVTSRIYDLKTLALEEKNYAASIFLDWYITEQVEEEANFVNYLKRLKLMNENPQALEMMNRELGARVWTPLPEAML